MASESECPACGRVKATRINQYDGVEPMESCGYHLSDRFYVNCLATQNWKLRARVAELEALKPAVAPYEKRDDFIDRIAKDLPPCDLNSMMAKRHLVMRLAERETGWFAPPVTDGSEL